MVKSSFKYLKIAGLFFIIPAWNVAMINEGAVLWKTFTWFNQDIQFWTIPSYLFVTLLVAFIPFIYLIWFYYLVVKKTMRQLHQDFFQSWNLEIGDLLADSLIALEEKRKTQSVKVDIQVVISFLNRKLSQLPSALGWVARKVVDQIPLVEFINAYDVKDLEQMDKAGLSESISTKLNSFLEEQIDSIVPGWTKFIIPINILLLGWLFTI